MCVSVYCTLGLLIRMLTDMIADSARNTNTKVTVKQFPRTTMVIHPLPRHVATAPSSDFEASLNTQRALFTSAAADSTLGRGLSMKIKI